MQKNTRLKIIDNSGAKKVICIHIKTKSLKILALPGFLITSTVRALRNIPRKRILEGRDKQGGRRSKKSVRVWPTLITAMKRKLHRLTGTSVHCNQNTAAILNKKDLLPLSNRFVASIFFEVKESGHLKASALAKGIV